MSRPAFLKSSTSIRPTDCAPATDAIDTRAAAARNCFRSAMTHSFSCCARSGVQVPESKEYAATGPLGTLPLDSLVDAWHRLSTTRSTSAVSATRVDPLGALTTE